MNSIQLSFEIATSISIIGAALVFLWGQIGQSKRSRVLAIRQQRIEQMSILIADFAVLLDGGDLLVEKSSNCLNSTESQNFISEYIFVSAKKSSAIFIFTANFCLKYGPAKRKNKFYKI